MKQHILLDILSRVTDGTYTTRELIRASGYSPNTVVRYLDDLEKRGLIERVRATKLGPGRPPIVLRATERGLSWAREDQMAVFSKLHHDLDALWGPKKSFSFWGVPFYGKPDIFAKEKVDSTPFELVIEKRPSLYANSIETGMGVYPSLESLATWASSSPNPRFLAATAVLLRGPRLNVDRLVSLAKSSRAQNRVGFLATLSGASEVAKRIHVGISTERMLPRLIPVESETAELARRWKVSNPVSAAIVKEMVQLYGGSK